MRWFILSAICFANISNAINWINFSPIADYTGDFYSVDFEQVNYLSLIYLITSTPAGFFSFWLIDSFGVRLSLNLGSWFNLIGSIVRLVSALDMPDGTPIISHDYKYTVLFSGKLHLKTEAIKPFLITFVFRSSYLFSGSTLCSICGNQVRYQLVRR